MVGLDGVFGRVFGVVVLEPEDISFFVVCFVRTGFVLFYSYFYFYVLFCIELVK